MPAGVESLDRSNSLYGGPTSHADGSAVTGALRPTGPVVCRPTEVVEIALSTGLFSEMRCGISVLAIRRFRSMITP